jgi:hypothetical protein
MEKQITFTDFQEGKLVIDKNGAGGIFLSIVEPSTKGFHIENHAELKEIYDSIGELLNYELDRE